MIIFRVFTFLLGMCSIYLGGYASYHWWIESGVSRGGVAGFLGIVILFTMGILVVMTSLRPGWLANRLYPVDKEDF